MPRLTAALHSAPGNPTSVGGASYAPGLNLNLELVPQASVSRDLTLRTSRLGTSEPYQKDSTCHKEETVPLGAVGDTESGRNLHAYLRPPSSLATLLPKKPGA